MIDLFFSALLVGFFAQIIDGALGMGYGVLTNTFLLQFGLTPAVASANVHLAELFNTGVSGLSHWKMGNVDWALFKKLIIPGMLGGILGAYVLTEIPGDVIKPFVSVYLLLLGAYILWKAFKLLELRNVTTKIKRLAFVGGFFDAIGGGGWGPIVTSTLLARGNHPRFTIGSVNTTEFFVTGAQSLAFVLTLGFVGWNLIGGLIIGGVIAAPLGALVCKKISAKSLMLLVGSLIVVLNLWSLLRLFI